MLILTNLSGWLWMTFSPNLCIKKIYHREKAHSERAAKKET